LKAIIAQDRHENDFRRLLANVRIVNEKRFALVSDKRMVLSTMVPAWLEFKRLEKAAPKEWLATKQAEVLHVNRAFKIIYAECEAEALKHFGRMMNKFFALGKKVLQIIEAGDGVVESLQSFQASVEKWKPDLATMTAAEYGINRVMDKDVAASWDQKAIWCKQHQTNMIKWLTKLLSDDAPLSLDVWAPETIALIADFAMQPPATFPEGFLAAEDDFSKDLFNHVGAKTRGQIEATVYEPLSPIFKLVTNKVMLNKPVKDADKKPLPQLFRKLSDAELDKLEGYATTAKDYLISTMLYFAAGDDGVTFDNAAPHLLRLLLPQIAKLMKKMAGVETGMVDIENLTCLRCP